MNIVNSLEIEKLYAFPKVNKITVLPEKTKDFVQVINH